MTSANTKVFTMVESLDGIISGNLILGLFQLCADNLQSALLQPVLVKALCALFVNPCGHLLVVLPDTPRTGNVPPPRSAHGQALQDEQEHWTQTQAS